FRLDTRTTADEYPAPVPAVPRLMQYISNTPIEELAGIPTLARSVEELKNALDRVELRFSSGPNPAADLERVSDGIVDGQLFHLPPGHGIKAAENHRAQRGTNRSDHVLGDPVGRCMHMYDIA